MPSKTDRSVANAKYAQRFKTKLCEKFQATGECPYEWRCMFAHGEQELRTKQMNIADGVVSEDTIRDFQRGILRFTPAYRRAVTPAVSGSAPGNQYLRDSDAPLPRDPASAERRPSVDTDSPMLGTPRSGSDAPSRASLFASVRSDGGDADHLPTPFFPAGQPTLRMHVSADQWRVPCRSAATVGYRYNPYPAAAIVHAACLLEASGDTATAEDTAAAW